MAALVVARHFDEAVDVIRRRPGHRRHPRHSEHLGAHLRRARVGLLQRGCAEAEGRPNQYERDGKGRGEVSRRETPPHGDEHERGDGKVGDERVLRQQSRGEDDAEDDGARPGGLLDQQRERVERGGDHRRDGHVRRGQPAVREDRRQRGEEDRRNDAG